MPGCKKQRAVWFLQVVKLADYLANEVPGVCIPSDTLRAMERADRGAARAVGIELAADLLRQARKLVSGVIVTAAEDDLTGLAPLLAAVG